MMKTVTCVACAAALVLVVGCAAQQRHPVASNSVGEPVDSKFLVNVDARGVALQGGHDPVAFFTEKKPVMGDAKFQATYKGAIYYFASAANRAEFQKNPAKYEPQFGGYCAYAASINKVSPISVEFFEIVDGRLILQHNKKAWDLWHADPANNLKKADGNWPTLVGQHGV